MAGETALALAARKVMDSATRAVGGHCDDLVPEHRPRRGEAELLDVGAAEPAREDGHELAGPSGSGTSASAG